MSGTSPEPHGRTSAVEDLTLTCPGCHQRFNAEV